jgi:CheY-like chemotaxis protein
VEEQPRLRVVVADDSVDIRTLIRMQLERDGRFEVLDEATDAGSAIELLRSHRPDIATFDLHMDGMADLGFLDDARSASPETAIVIVTGTYHPARDPDLDLADIDAWFTKDQIMASFTERLVELKRPS